MPKTKEFYATPLASFGPSTSKYLSSRQLRISEDSMEFRKKNDGEEFRASVTAQFDLNHQASRNRNTDVTADTQNK